MRYLGGLSWQDARALPVRHYDKAVEDIRGENTKRRHDAKTRKR